MMSPGFTPAFCAGLPGTTRITRHGNTAGLGTASTLGGGPKYAYGAKCPAAMPCSTW